MSFRSFCDRQINTIKEILKDKAYKRIIIAIILFLILNVFKIAVFNYYILPTHSIGTLLYKIVFTFTIVLIIYPILFRPRHKYLLLIFYVLQILFIAINVSYYIYFHNYLHINDFLSLFSEGFSAVAHSSASINPVFILFFIDLPVFIYIIIKYNKTFELTKKLKPVIAVIVICCICAVSAFEIRNYIDKSSVIHYMKNKFKGESLIVLKYGTIVNNIVNIYQGNSEAVLVSNFRYGEVHDGEEQSNEKPNFVIIQVESMDANVVNQKHNGNYIAPYLNSLSNNSIFYPYVLSYHMGGGTSDVEFSIINSIQPLTNFPAIKLSSYNYPNSILKQLTSDSYKTVAFHGNQGNFFNRDVAFPKMGFEEFFDMNKMGLKHVGWGAPDKEVFDYTAKTIKTLKEPFLSYIITMTSHKPFTNVYNYYKNDDYNDVKDENVKNYFNSISYVDKSIEEFVTDIKNNFKNTYIFIYGDHTPNITTDEYKQASFIDGENYFEFVPMFIITPDNVVHKEQKQVVSFMDVSPTILKASGIKYNIESDGEDILNVSPKTNKVEFKDSTYDRAALFERIKNIHN